MSSPRVEFRRWADHGTKIFDQRIASISETEAEGASLLPGWSRKHLIAHVSANAVALANLVEWAATGVPKPMYESREQRDADIENSARLSLHELLTWFAMSAANLADKMDRLTPEQWGAEVRTAQGRTLAATAIPWLRAREVMVHSVDLGTGLGFADLPDAFLAALCHGIVAKRNALAGSIPTAGVVVLDAIDAGLKLELHTDGEPTVIRGDLADVAAFLAGRAIGTELKTLDGRPLPDIGPWL